MGTLGYTRDVQSSPIIPLQPDVSPHGSNTDAGGEHVEASVAPLPQFSGSHLNVHAIAEAALLLDVTVLLSLIQILIPIPGFQSIVRLACVVPFILLTLRRGVRVSLIASLACYVLLAAFVGPLVAIAGLFFGLLGTLFGWASQHRVGRILTIVAGAAFYGVFLLLLPFLFSLYVLRINLPKTLHDVHRQAGSFVDGLGHIHVGSVSVSAPIVSALSASSMGRGLLDLLHGVAIGLLTHPLATFLGFFALYSLVHVWAYLIVSIELYARLPEETRRNEQGQKVDFFPIR